MNYLTTLQQISLDGEIWNPITNYETKYFISNKGRIFSLYKVGIMALRIKNGYSFIKFGKKHLPVHRIVASEFIPNPLNKPQVNHIDSNPSNNNTENLEWVTAKENIQHAVEAGRFMSNKRKSYLRSIKGKLPKQFEHNVFVISKQKVGKHNPKSKPCQLFDKNMNPIQIFESINLCAKFIKARTSKAQRSISEGYKVNGFYVKLLK